MLTGIALILAGCRTDPAIALLERDNRLKEDEIYRLRQQVEDLEESLSAHGVPPPVAVVRPGLPPPLTPPGGPTADLNPPVPDLSPRPRTSPGGLRPMTRGGAEPPAMVAPPVIDMPQEALPPGQVPERMQTSPQNRPSPGTTPSTGTPGVQWNRARSAQPVGTLVAAVDNSKVAQITLNTTISGGYSRTEGNGDEGLLLVVEPRDMSGNILDAPAEINVVLLDPALDTEAGRVARWDFTEAQTAGMILGGQNRGIHLELRWPSRPPTHDKLTLFIRYKTHDGRKLQIERPVTVALPADRSTRQPPVGEGPLRPSPTEAGPVRMATRPDDPRPDDARPRRPVWSPDRTY